MAWCFDCSPQFEMSSESGGEILQTAHRTGQAVLIDLLNATLEVAASFLRAAKICADDSPSASQSGLRRTTTAIESLRHFAGRVEDPVVRSDIWVRIRALERELAEFAPSLTRGKLIVFPGPADEGKIYVPGKRGHTRSGRARNVLTLRGPL